MKKPTTILFALLIFTVMLGGVFLLLTTETPQEISTPTENPEPLAQDIEPIETLSNISIPMPLPMLNEYLVLVNHQHAIANEPDHSILIPAWPTVPVSTTVDMYLHPTALNAVADMFASAREADIGSFFVTSGFRSHEAQAALYGDGSNSAFVMPPGHSEHQTGLAADIMAVGVGQWELADSPQGQWLAANSWRYGLILRYPEGATHITGIAFEPWHFRYVGAVHAYYMWRNNLVLEQYIELLQSGERDMMALTGE